MIVWVVGSLAFGADTIDAERLLTAYEAVRLPLAQDRLAGVRDAARALGTMPEIPAHVAAAGLRVADATNVEDTRRAFGELSRVLVIELAAEGLPRDAKVFRCPMTDAWPYWLQGSAGIANPYMGLSMPTCGEGTSFKAAAKAAEPEP